MTCLIFWQKLNVHVVLIKHLDLQITQLSIKVNKCKLGTLQSNTIQYKKNAGKCKTFNTRGARQIGDPLMRFKVETVSRKDI